MVKISRNRMMLHRVYRMKLTVKADTQKIREGLLRNMQELFQLAKQQAQNGKLALPERQKWVRVASYAAQVMNSITKSFDEAQVTEDLQKLEKMIDEAMAKEKSGEPTTTG